MIYLYLKTHNITGLKYLGKTIQDPYIYKGSGKRWSRHINLHGNNVTTTIIFESNNKDEIKQQGLYYSSLWNIVADQSFANLKPEEGDGGDMSMCQAYHDGIKKRNTSGSKNSMYGRSAITEQTIRWYNNGVDNIYVPENTQPNNFVLGRLINYKKPHSAETKEKLSRYGRKKCISPTGEIFDSRKDAAATYNITPEAIGGLIKRGVSGWRWL
jgi:hypothetical protein